MIVVKLYTREAGHKVEVGSLEFYGVPVARPDGSTWIAFDSLGDPRPGQVKLIPAGIASGAEIRAICRALYKKRFEGKLAATNGGRNEKLVAFAATFPSGTEKRLCSLSSGGTGCLQGSLLLAALCRCKRLAFAPFSKRNRERLAGSRGRQ
jgi:hypothetical protein